MSHSFTPTWEHWPTLETREQLCDCADLAYRSAVFDFDGFSLAGGLLAMYAWRSYVCTRCNANIIAFTGLSRLQ